MLRPWMLVDSRVTSTQLPRPCISSRRRCRDRPAYMRRETERVIAKSRGLNAGVLSRAARTARSLERQLA